MNVSLVRMYLFLQGLAQGWRREEQGWDRTEDVLILALIVAVCLLAVLELGNQIQTLLTFIAHCLKGSTSCAGL